MQTRRRTAGYTLIEVIVALLVFTVAALALAVSSTLIAQVMATNALRERGERVAGNRIALIKSQCGTAVSGSERVQQVESAWSVARYRSRVSITESASYMSLEVLGRRHAGQRFGVAPELRETRFVGR